MSNHCGNLEKAYYLGLLCGTSADAVHAAVARFADNTTELISSLHLPLEDTRRLEMHALGAGTSLEEYARLDAELGDLFAATALQLLRYSGVPRTDVAAIGSLGYTAWHKPRPEPRSSLQIADPNRIAWHTGITTVADFRRMDQAAGGEGAPITPGYHAWQFRREGIDRAVLNLGGIANLTLLPGDPKATVIGLDTGPANVLLDSWIRECKSQPMDEDGSWASTGRAQPELLACMLEDEYFKLPAPKSTGPEHFNAAWLHARLAAYGKSPPGADVQATLVELTAHTISEALRQYAPACQEVLLCGGGVHNQAVVTALEQAVSGARVLSTSHYGVDPDYVEAVVCAWLARQRLLGRAFEQEAMATAAAPGAVLGAVYCRPES